MAQFHGDLIDMIRTNYCCRIRCRKLMKCKKLCNKARGEFEFALRNFIVARPDFGLARIVEDIDVSKKEVRKWQ